MYLLNFKSGTERLKELKQDTNRQLASTVIGAGLLGSAAKLTEKAYKKNKNSKFDKILGIDKLNKSILEHQAQLAKEGLQKLKINRDLELQKAVATGKFPDKLGDLKATRRRFGQVIKEELEKTRNSNARTRLGYALGAGALAGGAAGLIYNKLRKARADKGKIRGKYNNK